MYSESTSTALWSEKYLKTGRKATVAAGLYTGKSGR